MIPNDRQTGPAEEGEARLASPSSQSSVQQSIPDEDEREKEIAALSRDHAAFGPSCCEGCNRIRKLVDARSFLAGSTVSGQGEG